jgi:pimeloyl-ACP methyl ester carboxylesterase
MLDAYTGRVKPRASMGWATLALLPLALRCGTAPPPPSGFYTPETRPRAVDPGANVRSEEMKGAPPGAKAWRVLYASTGLRGQRIEVSGVVIAPELPPPQGGRAVVAWAHPTTGVSDKCAPSTNPNFFDTIPHLPALIALDYVVAATDYQGLGTPGPHPYLVGESEGRSVLDSVRAAARLPKTGAGPRFVVWGHSQGGHAALFAGQLAHRYAPDLALVGIAAISPPTDLRQLLQDDFSERVGRILTAYALWSWSEIFGAPLTATVYPSTIPRIERVARDCVETEDEGYRVGLDSFAMGDSFLIPGALDEEPWRRLLVENRPGAEPIGAPVYVAQGTEDPIVRPSVTADFVRGLCDRGEVVRYEELSGAGHMRAARISASSAVQWMAARFEGRTAPSTCSPPRL